MDFTKLIINLNNRPNRLISCIQELKKVNLNDKITIIDAVTPDLIKDNLSSYITIEALNNIKNPKNTLIIPNYTSIACAESHKKCWKYIIDKNIKDCIIIEDDIKINDVEKFKFDLQNIINLNCQYNGNTSSVDTGLFITFNSKEHYISDYKELNIIKGIFTGLHFYYINNLMAKHLYDNIKFYTYQIDIEIGLLSMKMNSMCSQYNNFYNIKTNSIIQNTNFISDVQFYNISINEISQLFNININISNQIYNYIPDVYKKNKSYSKNLDYNGFIDYNGLINYNDLIN